MGQRDLVHCAPACFRACVRARALVCVRIASNEIEGRRYKAAPPDQPCSAYL